MKPLKTVSDFLSTPTPLTYTTMALTLKASLPQMNLLGARILLILADATVAFDSNAGENNAFNNISKVELVNGELKYVINEPHGGRTYYTEAMISEKGFSIQKKQSNTLYYAVRQGSTFEPMACLVLTCNA